MSLIKCLKTGIEDLALLKLRVPVSKFEGLYCCLKLTWCFSRSYGFLRQLIFRSNVLTFQGESEISNTSAVWWWKRCANFFFFCIFNCSGVYECYILMNNCLTACTAVIFLTAWKHWKQSSPCVLIGIFSAQWSGVASWCDGNYWFWPRHRISCHYWFLSEGNGSEMILSCYVIDCKEMEKTGNRSYGRSSLLLRRESWWRFRECGGEVCYVFVLLGAVSHCCNLFLGGAPLGLTKLTEIIKERVWLIIFDENIWVNQNLFSTQWATQYLINQKKYDHNQPLFNQAPCTWLSVRQDKKLSVTALKALWVMLVVLHKHQEKQKIVDLTVTVLIV